MAIIQKLLQPSVVTGMFSRIAAPGNPLIRRFGMQIGGPNVNRVSGRSYSFDIMDNVRGIAKGRAPATGPAVHTLAPAGRQTNTFPRAYEKVGLDYETLHNIRALGKNAGEKDRMGVRYVEAQVRQQKLRQENWREFQLAALLTRGSLVYKIDGEDWIPKFSLAAGEVGFTQEYQIPAGNKTQLNMLGAGNILDTVWSNAAADIPGDIDGINAAFQQLTGEPLALAITDSIVWNNVLNNTKLQAQGGSVNSVFAEYDVLEEYTVGEDASGTGMPRKKLKVMRATLRARPWLEWLIIDTGLEVDGTYTKHYDGTRVTFMIEPDPYWLAMQEGSEPVKENPMAQAFEAFGFTGWIREWDEPARVELHSLQNSIVECKRPKGIAIGVVNGF